LADLSDEALWPGQRVVDSNMADACRAGLWLRYHELDRSHEISQQIETSTGSFWHGIMHRREGDYANAKYWFRRVGNHPIERNLTEKVAAWLAEHPDVAELAPLAEGRAWDPFRFVDLCQQATRRESRLAAPSLAIQGIEWRELFDFCYRAAVGQI
jgi:hypothetical protein